METISIQTKTVFSLKVGDDVQYLGLWYKVKKVFNHGGTEIYYDLTRGFHPQFPKIELEQLSVHCLSIFI